MNLEHIFAAQKDLDEEFSKNIAPGEQDLKLKCVIALIVEIGEFANEFQEFKYWKVHKNINRQALLEEYADGIHFLSSLSASMHISPIIEPLVLAKTFSCQLAEVYKASTKLLDELNSKNLTYCYRLYLGLAKVANISEEEILASFARKNQINHQRAHNKY
ncbi:dUTP diphosphatase [Mycoplasma sp. 4044]